MSHEMMPFVFYCLGALLLGVLGMVYWADERKTPQPAKAPPAIRRRAGTRKAGRLKLAGGGIVRAPS